MQEWLELKQEAQADQGAVQRETIGKCARLWLSTHLVRLAPSTAERYAEALDRQILPAVLETVLLEPITLKAGVESRLGAMWRLCRKSCYHAAAEERDCLL